jgi:hypothetical protein
MADVSTDGEGLVRYFYANGQGISFLAARTSYLTVLVDTTYYTNNPNLVATAAPKFPVMLQGGSTKKIKDTIETVWQPKGVNGFDIVQDIYPVAFPIMGCGQIVFKFKIRNHESSSFVAQAQYMIDVCLVKDVNTSNDNAPITTRYGYLSTAWTSFPTTNPIPPYYIGSLATLPSGSFPTLLSIGFNNDSLAPEPMGLMTPTLFSFVDWTYVATEYTWGGPSTPPPGQPLIGDDALILQWGASNVGANDTVELGRDSYGTPGCTPICLGNALDAMIIHPDHIIWDPNTGPSGAYVPDHFPVEGVVWNQLSSQTANTVTGLQSITNDATGAADGPVKIVSPLPVTNNGYSQSHVMASTLNGGFSTSISWEDTVLAGILTNCSTDSLYDLALTITAGGVGGTNCLNGTYFCPIEVDCQSKDVSPPRHSPHVVVGNLNSCGNPTEYSDSVFDDRPTDLGLQSVTWTVTPNANAVKVVVGAITPCTNSEVPITVTQLDTLHAPCVNFTFTDCAGNVSTDQICFEACLPPGIIDTLPPRFRLLNRYSKNNEIPTVPIDSTNIPCEFQCSQWVVTDSVVDGLQHDAGLRSINVISQTNMSFNLARPVTLGMKEDTFSVCVTDSMFDGSIIIGAIDTTGHNAETFDTITYCTVVDTTAPAVVVSTPLANDWLVTVSETHPWDRGIDSVLLTLVSNCVPQPNPGVIKLFQINPTTWLILPADTCADTLSFNVEISDTFQSASFSIESWDCVGNHTIPHNVNITKKQDTYCPTDTIIHIGSDEIEVIFSDVHPNVTYDEGIDSIWFYNVHNMTMLYKGSTSAPHSIHEPLTGMTTPKFPKLDTVFFFVTDTTIHDTLPAEVCWDAVDGSTVNSGMTGNPLCANPVCWSYTLVQDTTPPILTVGYQPCDSITVNVTDTRTNDRGIYRVWDTLTVNMQPFSETDAGAASLAFNLPITDRTKSASGELLANDVWEHQATDSKTQAQHTDSIGIDVYRQDMAMIASGIVKTTSSVTFNVPVYLDSTDAFPLSQKNITQFQFSFHITGSNFLNFVGIANAPTMPAGWTVTAGPGPNYTITGTGPALTNLDAHDTMLYLVFTGSETPDIEEAQIVVDQDACGDELSYNAGTPTTVSTPNYSVTMPAPAGLLSGGTILFMDSCATIVGNNPHPTILSLAPAIPNPFSGSTVVQYTVPNELPVRLELYNALGQKIKTLVTETDNQGTYQVVMDGSNLQAGTYFLRLQANGQVCSQTLILKH